VRSVFQIAGVIGAFFDWPPCKFLVKTHAHRAAFCLFSLGLYGALLEQTRSFYVGDWFVVVLAVLFFVGNVAASIVSCLQNDLQHEKLVQQDMRTTSIADVAPVAASASPLDGNNTGANAPPGVIVTSFNEV
jgi:hypothetical protein